MVSRKENAADRRQKDIEVTPKELTLLDSMFEYEIKADKLLNNLTV